MGFVWALPTHKFCVGLGEAGGGEGEEGNADVGDMAQTFGTTE